MAQLGSYKVSLKDKDMIFPNNPIGFFLQKRNNQSIRALWHRLFRRHNLYTKCTPWGTDIHSGLLHNKIFSTSEFETDPRLMELNSCLSNCIPFYSVKNIYKVARENHWMNKQIVKEIEEIIKERL